MASITVYTTDFCPYCTRAKALLTKRGIAYEEVNLARDPDSREALAQRTGMYTYPQILIGDTAIGGFDQLLAADRDGRLQSLLAA
jgi:glutaredoxin 3